MTKQGDVLAQGNVVKTYKFGNTIVEICDDYCRNRTKEEIEKILSGIAKRAQAALSAQARKT